MIALPRCTYATFTELCNSDWEFLADRWLGPMERTHFESLSSSSRKITWLAGRILAKRMLGDCAVQLEEDHFSELEIVSRSIEGRGVRPIIAENNGEFSYSLSLAHTDRAVLVAIARLGTRLGVDLVERGDRPWTLRSWLTSGEQRRFGGLPAAQETLWAIKEAVYKACNDGESFAPRQIEVVGRRLGQFECRYQEYDRTLLVQTWLVDGHIAALCLLPASQGVRENETRTDRAHQPVLQGQHALDEYVPSRGGIEQRRAVSA